MLYECFCFFHINFCTYLKLYDFFYHHVFKWFFFQFDMKRFFYINKYELNRMENIVRCTYFTVNLRTFLFENEIPEFPQSLHVCPPRPWGKGGTSRFTMVSHHPNVSQHLHPCPSVCICPHLCPTLFMRYFLQFFTDGFQILTSGDHGKTLNWSTFCDLGSIFKVTEGTTEKL